MLLLGAYLSCLLVNVAPRLKIEIFFGAECRIMWTGMRRGACVGDLGLIQILPGSTAPISPITSLSQPNAQIDWKDFEREQTVTATDKHNPMQWVSSALVLMQDWFKVWGELVSQQVVIKWRSVSLYWRKWHQAWWNLLLGWRSLFIHFCVYLYIHLFVWSHIDGHNHIKNDKYFALAQVFLFVLIFFIWSLFSLIAIGQS